MASEKTLKETMLYEKLENNKVNIIENNLSSCK